MFCQKFKIKKFHFANCKFFPKLNINMYKDDNSSANMSSLNLYLKSLACSSNVASNVLRNDLWLTNNELFKAQENDIINVTKELVNHSDKSSLKNWKSSLSTIDPVSIMEQSFPECRKCLTTNPSGFTKFKHNECHCSLGLGPSGTLNKNINDGTNRRINSLFGRANSSESSNGEGNSNDSALFKPKFGRKRYADQNVNPSSKSMEIDTETIEDENKTHKSNVAKITFKTAKEQLLASNPAARRTLGASRKAKAKFVSPMIGAQEEKQEYSDPGVNDERLKHLDPKMIELIESEIIDKGTPIVWDDIAGLQLAKSVIQEAVVWPLLRPDIFTGLRRPPKGVLLFGPPGTGKTLIGKCVASQCNATFFSISASSLTSKWIGDGEKMVRALFAVARCHQPAVIFIDEIDSLLTARSDSEHEATRRIKTEFLVQFDGAATGDDDRLLIVGATNRPQELDEAARRRLVKRLYIPLPEADARQQIIVNLLNTENNILTPAEMLEVAKMTDGYSGADMKSLCSEAAMGPIRAVPLDQIVTIDRNKVRPVCLQDFINALQRVKPSVSQDDLGIYVKWNNTYGQGL